MSRRDSRHLFDASPRVHVDYSRADIVGLEAFGAEQAHRYRDYPPSEE